MPVFNIHHITRYQYDRPVKEGINEIRIYPYSDKEQETLFHEVNITSDPDVFITSDYWGNRSGVFNLLPSHRELVIESKLIIRTNYMNRTGTLNTVGFDELKENIEGNLQLLELSAIGEAELYPKIEALVSEFKKPEQSVIEFAQACSNYIFTEFRYIKGLTSIETTVTEILDHRSGVCQDFTHVMLEILRFMKIPGRYVSGYICPNKDGLRGVGATHAWVEIWLPVIGWIGIDPTNNILVTDDHVKLAVGRNFNDCSPVKGTFKGPAHQSLSVYVSIGYEDGHVFEDINNVLLEEQPGIPDLVEELKTFAGQQQQ